MVNFGVSSTSQVVILYSAVLLFMFLVVHFVPFSPADRRYGTEFKNDSEIFFVNTTKTEVNFIPYSVLENWRKTDFLVVMGIPSEDIPARRRRRNLQRKTCWTFNEVARKDNNYTGSMVVLYALARSPSNNFTYSSELREEAENWHDIVGLPLSEGKKSTNKQICGNGYWGIEAEIGMSRKAYFWYYMANKLFPLASYIAKGDDDMFLRVPFYLATLRILPKKRLYWGFGDEVNYTHNTHRKVRVFYTFGMCITLSANLVEQFLKYKPLRALVHTPYIPKLKGNFLSLRMDHEDVMFGIVLHNTGYQGIVQAWEKVCHFHNIHSSHSTHPVTLDSMVIHHIKEEEYEILMNMFSNKKDSFAQKFYRKENTIKFHCRPNLPTLYPAK